MPFRLPPRTKQLAFFPSSLLPTLRNGQPHQQQWRVGQGSWVRLALCIVVLAAFALNLRLFDRYPLRPDEAIYSVWALHFWRSDPLLLTIWPDKPPLFYWTLAPMLQLFGATGAGARWLNIALSTLTPLVVGATARRLWHNKAGLLATLLLALNPFGISFAATVYTDPLLVLCGQLALYGAVRGAGWGAGFWLGAAIMTKQQGLLYLPLVVGTLLIAQRQRLPMGRPLGQTALRFGLGAAVIIAPILYWDSLRWQVAPSPWDLSVRNYGALAILPPTAWLACLGSWWPLLWHLTANHLLWGLGTLLVAGAVWQFTHPTHQRAGNAVAILLLLWSLGFFLIHLVTSVQIWDRYLLPLAPLVALVMAWSWGYRPQPQRSRLWLGIGAFALLLLWRPALTAANGGYPIGGDHGAYAGLVEATTWLRTHAPTNVILYQQQLGWQAQFYLYDEQEAGAYELRWFPNPIQLADDAAKQPFRRRFLIQPQWAAMHNLTFHLTTRNLQLVENKRVGVMVVYTISERAPRSCDWCLCQPVTPWPIQRVTTVQSTPREVSSP